MPKLFILVFALILSLLSLSIVSNTLAQTGNQRIRELQPSIRVSTSPSTSTSPRTTTPPIQPTRAQTTTRAEGICKYLIAVYGSLGGAGGSQVTANEFGTLYILPDALDNNKSAFMQVLKADNSSALTDLGKLKITYQQLVTQTSGLVINKPIGTNDSIRTDGLIGQITVSTAPEKLNPNKLDNYTDADEAAFELYKAVYQLMFYANVTQNFFETFRPIQQILKQNGLPAPPFVVLGSDQGGFGFSNSLGFPQIPTLDKAVEALGCNINDPKRTISGSPIIHLYSTTPVNIHLPATLTYTNQQYSLINGIIISSHQPLYYEFNPQLLKPYIQNLAPDKDQSIIVNGAKLEDYLITNLLPQLKLTDQEIKDFIKYDISPQLPYIQSDKNYQINLLQHQQLDSILPLKFTPHPDTLIRNLLVIVSTSDRETNINLNKLINIPTRVGSTIVENGLVLLD